MKICEFLVSAKADTTLSMVDPDGSLWTALDFAWAMKHHHIVEFLSADPDRQQALAAAAPCGVDSCTQPGTKRCAACNSVSYCSQDHQRQHWKEHKKVCAEMKQTAASVSSASPSSAAASSKSASSDLASASSLLSSSSSSSSSSLSPSATDARSLD